MRIVFFGDSITEGYKGISYVKELELTLNQRNPTELIEIVNYGQSGDMLENLYKKLTSLQPPLQKYHWCVLAIGVNDVYYDGKLTEPTIFFSTYEKALHLAAQWGEKILVIPPFQVAHNKNDPANIRLADVSNGIMEQAAKLEQAVFINMYTSFMEQLESGNDLTTDGVHLNQEGAIFLAKALADVICHSSLRN